MLSIGLQMALNYSITAIGTMIFQAAVNVFGSQVVAAYTAASKVSNIATQTMPTLEQPRLTADKILEQEDTTGYLRV